ncbi:hypothetical protein Cni_G27289 [Canna indica]|uniref:Uncharacterized protein n=1 Tax=Canna indica TaxID=4628 RepID=A0AAQ3L0J2_9LILI|nr:hypothetical protein Cni_G27289 [Canna indica]
MSHELAVSSHGDGADSDMKHLGVASTHAELVERKQNSLVLMIRKHVIEMELVLTGFGSPSMTVPEGVLEMLPVNWSKLLEGSVIATARTGVIGAALLPRVGDLAVRPSILSPRLGVDVRAQPIEL